MATMQDWEALAGLDPEELAAAAAQIQAMKPMARSGESDARAANNRLTTQEGMQELAKAGFNQGNADVLAKEAMRQGVDPFSQKPRFRGRSSAGDSQVEPGRGVIVRPGLDDRIDANADVRHGRSPADFDPESFLKEREANRPGNPAYQREYDMWTKAMLRSGLNRKHHSTKQTSSVIEVGDQPEGWVIDPRRGKRYSDAPRDGQHSIDSRQITHAAYKVPDDPNIVPNPMNYAPVRKHLSDGGRLEGQPYYENGHWYINISGANADRPGASSKIYLQVDYIQGDEGPYGNKLKRHGKDEKGRNPRESQGDLLREHYDVKQYRTVPGTGTLDSRGDDGAITPGIPPQYASSPSSVPPGFNPQAATLGDALSIAGMPGNEQDPTQGLPPEFLSFIQKYKVRL